MSHIGNRKDDGHYDDGNAAMDDDMDPIRDLWCSSYVIPEYDERDDLVGRARSIAAALRPCLIPPPDVSSMSPMDRTELLQRYYPPEVVNFLTHPTKGIPHDELLEALQQVPYLVMGETPLERYMLQLQEEEEEEEEEDSTPRRKDKKDGEDGEEPDETSTKSVFLEVAATKIVLHWKFRKYFFGTRALFPMAMSRCTSNGRNSTQELALEGALSEEDVDWLNTGFLVLLPRETDTAHGGMVFASDLSRLPDHYSPSNPHDPLSTRHDNIALRIVFYTMHLNSYYKSPRNPHHSTSRIPDSLLVAAVQEKRVSTPYYMSWCHIFVENASPVKFRDMHFLLLPSRQGWYKYQDRKRKQESSSSSFLSYAISHSKRILQTATKRTFAYKFAFGYTDTQVVRKHCAAKGLNPDCFPTWMGGKFDMKSFYNWRDRQIAAERIRNCQLIEAEVERYIKLIAITTQSAELSGKVPESPTEEGERCSQLRPQVNVCGETLEDEKDNYGVVLPLKLVDVMLKYNEPEVSACITGLINDVHVKKNMATTAIIVEDDTDSQEQSQKKRSKTRMQKQDLDDYDVPSLVPENVYDDILQLQLDNFS